MEETGLPNTMEEAVNLVRHPPFEEAGGQYAFVGRSWVKPLAFQSCWDCKNGIKVKVNTCVTWPPRQALCQLFSGWIPYPLGYP